MITHSIKKPFVPFLTRIVDHFRQPEPPAPAGDPTMATHPTYNRSLSQEWTKLQYATWIEGVKQVFKVGDLVTLKQVPFVPKRLPVHWVITDIAEVHHLVSFDPDIKEPICLTVKSISGVVMYKCPSVLRRLTTGEKDLVDLLNTEPIHGVA